MRPFALTNVIKMFLLAVGLVVSLVGYAEGRDRRGDEQFIRRHHQDRFHATQGRGSVGINSESRRFRSDRRMYMSDSIGGRRSFDRRYGRDRFSYDRHDGRRNFARDDRGRRHNSTYGGYASFDRYDRFDRYDGNGRRAGRYDHRGRDFDRRYGERRFSADGRWSRNYGVSTYRGGSNWNEDDRFPTYGGGGTYFGALSAYEEPGNGIYFQSDRYDGYYREDLDEHRRSRRGSVKVITVNPRTIGRACSMESGVCVIRR